MKRASDAYLTEIYTLDEYKRIRGDLEKQIMQISDDMEVLRSEQPPEDNNRFKDKIHQVIDILGSNCELSVKQDAMRSIIDKIIYNSRDKSVEVYYYDV